jgi:hypothetical protein
VAVLVNYALAVDIYIYIYKICEVLKCSGTIILLKKTLIFKKKTKKKTAVVLCSSITCNSR